MKVKKTIKKRGKQNAPSPSWVNDPELIVFAGEKQLPVGGIEQHSLGEWAGSLFGRTRVEVKADWEKVVNQIRYLLDEVSAATKDYELTEITFELGFSAEGKIVFVAKAGITTTISAKFTHK
jgi:hypothetical protein